MAFGSKRKQRNGERKDNRGALFENDNRKGKTSPDFKGQATIDGREYWISGWEERSKNGQDYLSLSFQRKDEERREDYDRNGRRDDAPRDYRDEAPPPRPSDYGARDY